MAKVKPFQPNAEQLASMQQASKDALSYFRHALREVCPHDKVTITRYRGKPYCERCCDFLTPDEYNKIETH